MCKFLPNVRLKKCIVCIIICLRWVLLHQDSRMGVSHAAFNIINLGGEWNMDDYQLTIDDIAYVKNVTTAPGRSAFIDECGGFGFEFEKSGTLPYYVVCAVIVHDEDITAIEQKVAEMQQTLFGGKEMKSSAIGTKHRRRMQVLIELLTLNMNLVILIADKKKFYKDSPLTEYKTVFKKHLNQRLYKAMVCAFPKLSIVEDEYGTDEFQQQYRKYIESHRPANNFFNDYSFDYTDSRNSSIVQIADIIAGSVMAHLLDPTAPNVLRIFSGSISGIVKFPISDEFFLPSNSPNEYDSAVYQLACKCATDYVDQYTEGSDEEVRLRTLFLKYLLYNVRILNSSRYIHSSEIVQELSSMSEKRISKDFLYRRIIAPLRDEGIIIASCKNGYKIPTCVSDISAYINQTTTVVGPMLHRIDCCRSQIRKITDNKLDILNDPSLMAYKRYFGD